MFPWAEQEMDAKTKQELESIDALVTLKDAKDFGIWWG